jgi:hypothetical protein
LRLRKSGFGYQLDASVIIAISAVEHFRQGIRAGVPVELMAVIESIFFIY